MTTTIAPVSIATLATFLRPDLAGTSGTYTNEAGETVGYAFVQPEETDAFTLLPEDSTPERQSEILEWVLGKIAQADAEAWSPSAVHNLAAWALHLLNTLHGLAIEEDGQRFASAEWQATLYPWKRGIEVSDWACAIHRVDDGNVVINFARATPRAAYVDAVEALRDGLEASGIDEKDYGTVRTVVHYDEDYVFEYGMPADDANLYASAHEENDRDNARAEIIATVWPVPDRSEGSTFVDWKCALHKVSDGRLMYVSIGISPKSALTLARLQVREWTPDLAHLLDRMRLVVAGEGYEPPKWMVKGLTAK